MKFIEKTGEPLLLRRWRLANASTPQVLRYTNIPAAALAEVRRGLLREQGYLCAHTMLRISDERRGHIEHVLAQSHEGDRQVDYSNLVYCHPGGGADRCKFGAHAKDHEAVSTDVFISPLKTGCEARFAFAIGGKINPKPANDRGAIRTIEILNLNDPELRSYRRAAIGALPIFRRSLARLSAAQARKEAKRLATRDEHGRFAPFASALHHLMADYARRRSAREKASQRSAVPEGKR